VPAAPAAALGAGEKGPLQPEQMEKMTGEAALKTYQVGGLDGFGFRREGSEQAAFGGFPDQPDAQGRNPGLVDGVRKRLAANDGIRQIIGISQNLPCAVTHPEHPSSAVAFQK
jgi:hypothetical protein